MAARLGEVKLISDGLVLALDPASDFNYSLTEVEVLVVAGGGAGGGYGGNDGSGGGGGGGLIYKSFYPVTAETAYTVTVGNGGAAQASQGIRGPAGQNSIFGTLIATGGGGGGSEGAGAERAGGAGGSGGGCGGYGVSGEGAGTAGQGHPGGNCTAPGDGGGGGAGGLGENGGTGNGGSGLIFNIEGKPKWYAAGGGCGGDKRNARGARGGIGGIGGGGRGQDADNSIAAISGINGTGGGGGGAAGSNPTHGAGTTLPSGAGGKGIVVVRYPGPQKATGGDIISSIGGYTIHTFTNSGTFTPKAKPSSGGVLYGLQDLSADVINLKSNGSPTYSTVGGGSLVLNGTTQFLEAGYDERLNFQPQTPFSQFVWIYAPSGGGGAILSNMFGGTNQYSENYVGWDLWVNGPTSLAMHFIKTWNTNAVKISVDLTWANYSNSWLYIGATYDGSSPNTSANAINSINFYLNGSLLTTNKANAIGTTAFSDTDQKIIYASQQRFRIGSRFYSGAFQATAFTLGPVHIYDRVLSNSEILSNYNTLKGRFGL